MGAKLEDPDAVFKLALLYMYGLPDLPVNTTKAFELLHTANNAAQWKAPLLLAQLYQEHEDVPGGQDCGKALQHLWTFIGECSDFSELSMDALEMATGVPQPGGTASAQPANWAAPPPPLPHEPRRALMLYVMMAEQGCLSASMNAAWLLEHGVDSGVGAGRDDLVQYLYLRAALSDYPAAAVDYANWLLRHHAGGGEHYSLGTSRMAHRGGGRVGGSVGDARPRRSSVDAWPALLRLGIADSSLSTPASAVEQARLLYVYAEKLQDPEAATNLGWMYMAGVGAPRNLTMAEERYHAAIAMAGTEAEKWAPRAALACVKAWALVEQLLPNVVANIVFAIAGHVLRFAGFAFWVAVIHVGDALSTLRSWLHWPQVALL